MRNYVGSFRESSDNINSNFLQLVSLGRGNEATHMLEEHVIKFPHDRNLACLCWEGTRNLISEPAVERECARIFYEQTLKIREHGEKLFSMPPIMEIRAFRAFGETFDQTAFTNILLQNGKLKQKPILPLLDADISNMGALPYLSETFHIVTKREECLYWHAKTDCAPYSSYLTGFNSHIYGHISFFWNELKELIGPKNFNPNFVLKDETIAEAEPSLSKFGIDPDEPFVTLHTRSIGHNDGPQHELRNIDPSIYKNSIKLLIRNGIKVVRIGHPKMPSLGMEGVEGFIDLTKEERPGEVDIFLLAKALFYMGTLSGPYSVANTFGVPALLINVFPFLNARDQSLNLLPKFLDLKNGQFLSLKNILNSNLREAFSAKAFQRHGIQILPLQEFEVLEATKEMLGIFARLSDNSISEKKLDPSLHPNIAKSALIADVCSNLLED